MTELTKHIIPPEGAPMGAALGPDTVPSVRELLTELAALEDATRVPSALSCERLAALAREQEIIDELHRRCPEGSQPG